jgi:hypothetical protein
MNFRVLLENSSGSQSAQQATSSAAAHLAVDGADETLCCEPVSRFVPSPHTSHTDDDDVAWCWICRTTAVP